MIIEKDYKKIHKYQTECHNNHIIYTVVICKNFNISILSMYISSNKYNQANNNRIHN
jgi:hypothetical protein